MQDVLIIFCILLVLLTLISTFGGTLRTENYTASIKQVAPTHSHGQTLRDLKEAFDGSNVITAPAHAPHINAIAGSTKPSMSAATPVSMLPMSTAGSEPAGFAPDLDFAMVDSVVQEETSNAYGMSGMSGMSGMASIESFAQGPRHAQLKDARSVEPFDGSCQYASVQ